MKNLAIAVSVFLAGVANAQAEILSCDLPTENQTYLLVTSMKLGEEKAAIFQKTEYSNFTLRHADAQVAVAQGNQGGPIHILGRDRSEIDWSKETSCYKFRPGMSLTLNAAKGGGYTGEFRILPIVDLKPQSKCNPPRPIPPRPVDMKCNALNLN